MLAAIVLAALAFPAPGKYLYALTTASGAEVADDVWIYATSQGVVAHEELHSAVPIATTDQHFDRDMGLGWYLGASEGGSPLFMRVYWPEFKGLFARVSVSGKSTDIQLDEERPSCLLALDDGLTSSVLLPSLLHATGARRCIFVDVNKAIAIRATIDTTARRNRPKNAATRDQLLTVTFGNVTESIWYDPQSLIPDYIDFGNGASATWSASTGEQ